MNRRLHRVRKFVYSEDGFNNSSESQPSPIPSIKSSTSLSSEFYSNTTTIASTSKQYFAHAKLERVYGLSVTTNASLACTSRTGLVAYPAGCTIVLYNGKNNRQGHLVSVARKPFTCVAFSDDGRYLVTGESGHEPLVRVWEIETGDQIADFKGHSKSITAVKFSPNQSYLVSVGCQHDKVINVWNWKQNKKYATNKVSNKICTMGFSESGEYFVTTGVAHVKFWHLDRIRPGTANLDVVLLKGNSAILGQHKQNLFCDVQCGRGAHASKTFCIAQKGLLCEFNASSKRLERWVDVKTSKATSLAIDDQHVFVGCADAMIRVFDCESLRYVMNVQRPHYVGIDVALGLTPEHLVTHPRNVPYPQTAAMVLDSARRQLTVVYNDHSIYQWDLSQPGRIGKSVSQLNHVGAVWALDVYPGNLSNPALPPGSFVTAGADETIRFWNADWANDLHEQRSPTANELRSGQFVIPRRNIYSMELMKVLYVGSDQQALMDPNMMATNTNSTLVADNTTNQVLIGQNGIRSLRISPDGEHLATGDRSGNVRIHELRSMSLVRHTEAHDGEVLALEYSDVNRVPYLMASSSRDRLLHVYDVLADYHAVTTVPDHSSSVTCLKFVWTNQNNNDQLYLLSGSQDKSIVLRVMAQDPEIRFIRITCVASPSSLCDLSISLDRKNVYAASQDRQIRVYSLSKGKQKRAFKATIAEDGNLVKMVLDISGRYLLTCSSDKTLCVMDVQNGEVLAATTGHSELITNAAFTNDAKHVITVSADGCIFIWRLSVELSRTILAARAKVDNQNNNAIMGFDDTVDGSMLDDMRSEYTTDSNDSTSDRPKWPPHTQALIDVTSEDRGKADGASPPATDAAREIGDTTDDVQKRDSEESTDGTRSTYVRRFRRKSESDRKYRTGLGLHEVGTDDFGSFSNVRLLDDTIVADSPKIYLPDVARAGANNTNVVRPNQTANDEDDDQFEVQDRQDMLVRGSASNLRYAGADSSLMDDDDSDRDDSLMRGSVSMGNLRNQLLAESAMDLSGAHNMSAGAEPVRGTRRRWSNKPTAPLPPHPRQHTGETPEINIMSPGNSIAGSGSGGFQRKNSLTNRAKKTLTVHGEDSFPSPGPVTALQYDDQMERPNYLPTSQSAMDISGRGRSAIWQPPTAQSKKRWEHTKNQPPILPSRVRDLRGQYVSSDVGSSPTSSPDSTPGYGNHLHGTASATSSRHLGLFDDSPDLPADMVNRAARLNASRRQTMPDLDAGGFGMDADEFRRHLEIEDRLMSEVSASVSGGSRRGSYQPSRKDDLEFVVAIVAMYLIKFGN